METVVDPLTLVSKAIPKLEAKQIILVEHIRQKQGVQSVETTMYLPVYLRFIVKNFSQMDFLGLTGEINMCFYLSIYVGNLPKTIKQGLKSNVVVNFARNGNIRLQENLYNEEVTAFEEPQYLHFIIRKFVKAKVQPYVFFTPFQVVDLVITVSLRKIELLKQPAHTFTIKLNLMETNQIQEKFNFSNQCSFGSYRLSEKKITVEYTNRSYHSTLMELGKTIQTCKVLDQHSKQIQDSSSNFKNTIEEEDMGLESCQQLQRQQKIQEDVSQVLVQYVHYAHIHTPIYRHPVVVLGTLFVPLWLLGIINLAIFFQGPGLGQRIAAIATLMIAFGGLIPIVRDQLPLDSKLTLMQILLYFQMLTVLLSLIYSFRIRTVGDEFQKLAALKSPQFIISIVIMGIMALIPIVSYILYLCTTNSQNKFPQKPAPLQLSPKWAFSKWHSPEIATTNFQSVKRQYERVSAMSQTDKNNELKSKWKILNKVIIETECSGEKFMQEMQALGKKVGKLEGKK